MYTLYERLYTTPYTPGNKAEQALSGIKHTPRAESKMLCEFFSQKKNQKSK